jgi:hypothetical protein
MSEIILKFSDKDDDGNFEMNKAHRAVKADDAFHLLWDVDQELRKITKYMEDVPDHIYSHVDSIRDSLHSSGLLEMIV